MADDHTKTYLVTGASAGIGRAVTEALAARQVRVIAVARSAEPLESLAGGAAGHVRAVVADLSTDEGLGRVVAAVSHVAEIAGIVHAAGSLVSPQPYRCVAGSELVDHFRIHVATPIDLYHRLAANHVVSRMVFIDSYSASAARHGWSAYSIIKAAAQMSARCAAQELAETLSIRVFPGAVNTRVVDAVLASDSETAKAFEAIRARGELAEPADVAKFLVGLLIDASDDLLRSREAWDYNNAADRAAILA